MSWLTALETEPAWFGLVCLPVGLVIGSFLNVVIYRLPVMMKNEWHTQCRDLLELPHPAQPQTTLNLAFPASHCPHCGTPVAIRYNIPLVGYLLLRGRCNSCSGKISLRYPLVELLSGLMTFIVAWHFGWGMESLCAMLLTWGLLALAFIDVDEMLLPDSITLPLLWLGLLISTGELFVTPGESILGACLGYLSLWSVYVVFKRITGKEGMGYGDFKLLAMLGAWMGWKALPGIILISSVVGVFVGVGMMLMSPEKRGKPIPFGPYLAVAGWLFLLWGNDIQGLYLTTVAH